MHSRGRTASFSRLAFCALRGGEAAKTRRKALKYSDRGWVWYCRSDVLPPPNVRAAGICPRNVGRACATACKAWATSPRFGFGGARRAESGTTCYRVSFSPRYRLRRLRTDRSARKPKTPPTMAAGIRNNRDVEKIAQRPAKPAAKASATHVVNSADPDMFTVIAGCFAPARTRARGSNLRGARPSLWRSELEGGRRRRRAIAPPPAPRSDC